MIVKKRILYYIDTISDESTTNTDTNVEAKDIIKIMNYRIQHLFEGMMVGAFMIAEKPYY